MTKEFFKHCRFHAESLERISQCNIIIADYLGQGLRLTLRQLYYQLVTKNLITNEEKSYKKLSSLVSDARLAGRMDWDAIEDRVRVARTQNEYRNLGDLVEAAIYSYRLHRWNGQEYYIELWVEKDALAGVLSPLAKKFHVTMMVNRGYSSQSAMYESANRFKEKGKKSILLYLGDHDPSGEDMVRDIRERLGMFGVERLDVQKIALNMDQIEQYKPPPNPAKLSDPRAEKYIAKFGNESWEVDALPPNVLTQIIEDSISKYINFEKLNAVKEQEEKDKDKLRSVTEMDDNFADVGDGNDE
jgi:hypothetical protein